MSAKIKAFKEKYPHIWVVSYFIIYMIWFAWLESRADEPYHVIHFPLDDYIPFCEYFTKTSHTPNGLRTLKIQYFS